MPSDQQDHIERIRKDFQASQRVKDSLNNSIQALARDLYSKDTHFIFELIQNAEDNAYEELEPSLSFWLTKTDPTGTRDADGALIIQNNEIGFSSDNVDAICAVGKTTKAKIQGYIGEKGIGFKSVFRVTTTPFIFSNGYNFCLPEHDQETGLGYIVPQWIETDPEGIDPSQTTIILPLDKSDFGYNKIEEMLHDIEPESILFLSKLKEIQIKTETGDALTIFKDDSKIPFIQTLLEGKKQGRVFSVVHEFLLYTKTYDKPDDIDHEKRREINNREISIAFPLNEDYEGNGKIFAYLPVRSDTGLPFLINADFILPSSREDIQDAPWNRWLMDCVANLTSGALPLLKEEELLTVTLLETLAGRMNQLAEDENSMFHPIFNAVCNILLNKELLPAIGGTAVSGRNAKLAEGANLRELLNQDQLKSLFESGDEIKWLSEEITGDLTPNLHNYLRNQIDVKEIDPEGFARKINVSFLEGQPNEWMIKFYRFLKGPERLWKHSSSILRNKEFVRLHDGTHVPPFNEDGLPNAYLPIEGGTGFPVVEPEITKDENALEFLSKRLGLSEPDVATEVLEKIIPKYGQDTCQISSDEHKEDMRKIFRAFSTVSQEKRQLLVNKLSETSFIFAENKTLHQTAYKKPHCLYLRNDSLHIYLEGNEEAWFVSSKYDISFHDLFKEIGVKDSVYVKRKSTSWNNYVVIISSHGWHKRGLNGFDPNIKVDGLEYALQNPSMERSLLVWNQIVSPHSNCIRGVVESSSRQDYLYSDKDEQVSKFGHILIDSAWLPDTEGKFHKPSELGLDDLPEIFQRDETLSEKLGMKKDKDIVAELAEEVGVSVDDIMLIKQLRDHPDEYQKVKAALVKKERSAFPEKASLNVDRRKEKITKKYHAAPKKNYEKKKYSRKTTESSIDPKTWLKETYTNKEGELICQICQEEMPFKKRNGDYYFEAIELLDDIDRELEELHLALCPLCAAKYNEFVKHDEGAMEFMKNALMNSEDGKVLLQLGEQDSSVRFVESHFLEIKTIIQIQE